MSYSQGRLDIDDSGALATLGYSGTANDDRSGSGAVLTAGVVYYFKQIAGATGTFVLAEMVLGTGFTGHVHAALYADDGSDSPTGNPLDTSAEITNPVAGVIDFQFTGGASVTVSTVYWIAVQAENSVGWSATLTAPANLQRSQVRAYGLGFPAAPAPGVLGAAFYWAGMVVNPAVSQPNVFPTSSRYWLQSAWFEPTTASGFTFWGGFTTDIDASAAWGVTVVYSSGSDPSGPSTGRVIVNIGNGVLGSVAEIIFAAPDTLANVLSNVVVSIDAVGQICQCYLNGAALVESSSAWVNTNPITTNGWGLISQIAEADYGSVAGQFCVGDVYADTPAAFFDLSTPANLAKFIAGGLPVDPGTNGTAITGSTPIAFYTVVDGDPVTAFKANRGTGGGDLFHPGSLTYCVAPPPVSTAIADLAELFFSPTSAWFDLTITANREKFRTVVGATVDLGAQGINPLGVVPAVMLRATVGDAAAFAVNDGFGGAFAVTGGSLALAGSRPTCSDTTVLAPVVQGSDPQVILSVSDDGGRTWSLLSKERSIGPLGDYLRRIRWLKLGQARQRVIRLEITDPVRRNFIGFYTDTSKGMD